MIEIKLFQGTINEVFIHFILGADIIGTNCRFAPDDILEAALMMKDGIQAVMDTSSLSRQQQQQQIHYICQPNGWQFPCTNKHGVSEEPECPFGMLNYNCFRNCATTQFVS